MTKPYKGYTIERNETGSYDVRDPSGNYIATYKHSVRVCKAIIDADTG